ncbi:MAG TPA: ATP-binding protein [Vicinamibacterales bacterium]|nr:ATP-binding protein [Vicinamibacterales bacterium]
MSIKTKQVAGVTTLVVVIVAILSAYHLAMRARISLEETQLRGEMLARAVFQRAREVVPAPGSDLASALREDGGVRSILESGVGYGPNVTYAAIVDANGIAIVHAFRSREGQAVPEQEALRPVIAAGPIEQLRAVYSDRTFEIRQPVLADDKQFGSIRIGVSTLLIRGEFGRALRTAAGGVLGALLISSLVAILLAQWMLRPIHVIQSGLTRLGRGELDVSLDLPGEEFRDLGSSFEAVSAQLSAVRAKPLPEAPSDLASVMENLEDAVALFSPAGEVIFTNAAMKVFLADHRERPEIRQLLDQTLAGRKSLGPVSMTVGPTFRSGVPELPERLLVTHAISDGSGRFLGAMLVARNLGFLSHVHSTLNYSRKLAALGRLMSGVAHEVKNPLNAMTIHLELLKQKLALRDQTVTPAPDVAKHVNIIAQEIHRLDEVVVGFLKFARPEELKLQPVNLPDLIADVATSVTVEAERSGVSMRVECSAGLPAINADPGMLRQALLNLALNACQAMPNGGSLRMACRATRRLVEVDVEDTGAGIAPEHLGQIFDLYFTTKEKGSGIGLSMVYRIVQLHDGEVEVQSTPGRGTRFRLIFPQA